MTQLILPGSAQPSQVLNGVPFCAGTIYNGQGTMPNKTGAGVILTPSGSDQAFPQGYYPGDAGSGKVAAVVVPVANVLAGTTITGQAGTMPNKSGASLGSGTPTGGVVGSSKFDFDILLPSNGYMDTTTKVHQTLTNLIPANLLSGVTIPEIGLAGSAINGAGMKHFASGTASVVANQTWGDCITHSYNGSSVTQGRGSVTGISAITVSGLTFTPSVIVVYAASSDIASVYISAFPYVDKVRCTSGWDQTYGYSEAHGSPMSTIGTSFTMPVWCPGITTPTTMNWLAYD